MFKSEFVGMNTNEAPNSQDLHIRYLKVAKSCKGAYTKIQKTLKLNICQKKSKTVEKKIRTQVAPPLWIS